MADVDSEAKYEFIRLKKINGDLNRRFVEALLAEQADRYRILDEFQDTIVQKLVGIRLTMEPLLKNKNSLNAELLALRDTVISTIKSAHRLADDIAPHVLLSMGLEASLHELSRQYARDSCFSYSITCDPAVGLINGTTRLILYQLIRRLLHGVVYLCHANMVRINIRVRNATVEVILEDNGAGYDISEIILTGQYNERPFTLEATETVRLLGGSAWSDKSQGISTTCMIIPLKGNDGLQFLDISIPSQNSDNHPGWASSVDYG